MVSLFISILLAFTFQNNSIKGLWLTQNKQCKILIYKQGSVYQGEIYWLERPFNKAGKPVVDKQNPEPALREKPLMHQIILHDFVKAGNRFKGTVYNAEDGRSYQAECWLSDDTQTLYFRGYLLFFYKTEKWIRVENEE